MQIHELHSASLAATLLVVLHCANYALAQSAPVSSHRPWHSSAERNIEADLRDIPDSRFTIDSAKTYSLPELLDIAEAHNPATRDSWERARAQAAALGVARSELFPMLEAVAVSETGRQEVLFGDRFSGQVLQTFQMELDLNYTLYDFGARTGRINAAKAQLLAANFVFNDTHRQVIYQVRQAYYRLLSSMGQEDAARASLSNAQAVQRAAEQRLAHGLATQPDVLEARSATARAEYDLQAILGAEEIARGDLATALGASASTVIQIKSPDQIPSRESIGDTVDQAINRALEQRPDLMQQMTEIRSENARVQEARAAYYPALTLNVTPAIPSLYGLQFPYPWSHAADKSIEKYASDSVSGVSRERVATFGFRTQWALAF